MSGFEKNSRYKSESVTMTKKVFTTGEVARLLGININTAIKWFDGGDLKGFRLPGSNERRITLAGLQEFMVHNQIPLDLLEENTPMRRMHRRLPVNEPAELTIVNGRQYGPYAAAIIDLSMGGARLRLKGAPEFSMPMGQFTLSVNVIDGPLKGQFWRGDMAHMKSGDDSLTMGMRFTDFDEIHTQQLADYLHNQ